MTILATIKTIGWSGGGIQAGGAAPGLLFLPGGSVGQATFVCWMNASNIGNVQGTLFTVKSGGHPLIALRYRGDDYGGNGTDATLFLFDDATNVPPDVSVVAGPLCDGEWHHVGLVFDATHVRVYVDGLLVGSAALAGWTPITDAAETLEIMRHSGASLVSYMTNIAILGWAVSASEMLYLAAAGLDFELTEAFGGWPGGVPEYYWGPNITAGSTGTVANSGSAGVWALDGYSVGDGFSYVALTAAPAATVPSPDLTERKIIRRIATRPAPPLHTFYTLTGSVGSFMLLSSTAMSRLFFPLVGGLGQAMFRFWFRRPVTPVTTGGTLGQVTVGDATITVGLDATEHPTVTVSDGTITLSDTATDPLGARAWRQFTFVADGALDRLRVYLNATLVAEVDTSTMTFDPDVTTDMTVTVGSKSDGTVPIDIDVIGVAGVAGIDDAGVSDADIEELFHAGPYWNIFNPYPPPRPWWDIWKPPVPEIVPFPIWNPGPDGTGNMPEPGSGYTIFVVYGDADPGSIVEGEGGYVPGSGTTEFWEYWDENGGDGGGLIIFDGTQEPFVSDFWAWPISTHRIGVYSTAWWPGSALIASNWHLTYDTGEVTTGERVFGECPRVARVLMRGDGVLLVDVDAVLQPRVTYVLSVDVDDLADNNPGDMSVDGPVPAREHTADLVPALLDIDAPLRAGLRVTDSGDFGMASETRTVEKMLWALVLTPRGSVDWDPQFGSALRAKRLRPMDLKQEHRRLVALAMGVPYVKAAAVQLLFEGDEIVVEFNITSDFGSFYTRRAVDAS